MVKRAKWLDVDEHWLHYGASSVKDESAKGKGSKVAASSPKVIKLAQKIQCLPPHRRYLVEELINRLQEAP